MNTDFYFLLQGGQYTLYDKQATTETIMVTESMLRSSHHKKVVTVWFIMSVS